MKVLVTGGAGFIGSAFIRYYLDAYPEDEVVNLDALTYSGNLENLRSVEDNERYSFVKGSITDKELVEKLVEGVDAIVNFAAETHVDRSIMDSSAFVETNVAGTQVLLDAAVKLGGKRFHQVSTDEVFGSLMPDEAAFTEESQIKPRNPYSATKAGGELLALAYFETHGLPVTVSNCSNNYGEYQFPEKAIPLFVSRLKAGEKIPVYGDGKQIRDWIYVGDHVSGIALCLKDGKPGERYVFGDDKELENLELIDKLIELTGASSEQIEFVKDRLGHDRRYATDSAKARRELGWSAKVGLDEGLANTVKWYEENADWVGRCMSGEYKKYYDEQYIKREQK